MMHVISLGWGIQSTTMAFMVALGELEPVDYAIHADTTHEFSGTYEFAKRWTPWLEEHGMKVVTVQDTYASRAVFHDEGRIGEIHAPFYTILNTSVGDGYVAIPVFTQSDKGGQLHRSCTQRWKIAPMRRFIQAHRNDSTVEQWIGISWDESQRMRDSDVKYITHRWPLIEKRMTRNDCIAWLKAHNLEVPPRSACNFCPFKSKKEWRRLQNYPDDWNEAVQVDLAIRKARPPYDLYVCSQRKPLTECDFSTLEDHGQMQLFTEEECSGVCFV
jgi:3'-phosphoadenosine 5'-phosphosulfate sulfotransferase (PAPS reductase)/FAD synthetase